MMTGGAQLLAEGPASVAYACTAVSFALGPAHDATICQRIHEASGSPGTTTATAIMALTNVKAAITQLATNPPMLIACPNCTTSYDLDPSSLGRTGRSVRCVRCRQVWFATNPGVLTSSSNTSEAWSARPSTISESARA